MISDFIDWLFDGAGMIVVWVLVVIALVFFVIQWDKALNDKREWCESQGGHVTTHTETGTGISPGNGQVVVTTNTTYYCLTDDGRILDIW